MISCCCNSPNLPMCYLLDCIMAKYHPGSRITILLIHPANFTVSPFHFVSYNFFKKQTNKLVKLKHKFRADFVFLAEKFGIPPSSIFFLLRFESKNDNRRICNCTLSDFFFWRRISAFHWWAPCLSLCATMYPNSGRIYHYDV